MRKTEMGTEDDNGNWRPDEPKLKFTPVATSAFLHELQGMPELTSVLWELIEQLRQVNEALRKKV